MIAAPECRVVNWFEALRFSLRKSPMSLQIPSAGLHSLTLQRDPLSENCVESAVLLLADGLCIVLIVKLRVTKSKVKKWMQRVWLLSQGTALLSAFRSRRWASSGKMPRASSCASRHQGMRLLHSCLC